MPDLNRDTVKCLPIPMWARSGKTLSSSQACSLITWLSIMMSWAWCHSSIFGATSYGIAMIDSLKLGAMRLIVFRLYDKQILFKNNQNNKANIWSVEYNLVVPLVLILPYCHSLSMPTCQYCKQVLKWKVAGYWLTICTEATLQTREGYK